MSYIGIIGAKRLDDSNASLGLIEAQKKAVQLLRCSTDMHMIKQQTGWEMGVDGKWRYEVADPFHNTVEIEDHLKRHFGESINISLCMHDISLLIAYPAFERLSLLDALPCSATLDGIRKCIEDYLEDKTDIINSPDKW